jgi:(1->4)-alpha-D-glucan 1-alpha-D-glucosylmutase
MRSPLATYRLQFNPLFGFNEAKQIVPYLAELGISDIYASPIFKSKHGSHHGYDIVDHNQLNPELGATEDFEDLAHELEMHKMGWLQDVVPNHMSYSYENLMLSDILERGSNSRYFTFFDINWEHPCKSLKSRLQAPFLKDLYRNCLERGEIKLVFDDKGLAVTYNDLRFPLKLKSYAWILNQGFHDLKRMLGDRNPSIIALMNIIQEADSKDPEPKLKKMLWDLCLQNNEIRRFLDSNLHTLQGRKEIPSSFDLLDDLISEQIFRLCFWKVASFEINYRRFFIMNDLISLNAENKDVFNHIHSLIFDLVKKGRISGLRIDHVDGLNDPTEYLTSVRERLKEVYLVVEKILLLGESLPSSWSVQGTTGYDFLNYMNGVLCDKDRRDEFSRIYSRFTGRNTSYDDVIYESKKLIANSYMSGDVDNLARYVKEILDQDRYATDITFLGIKKALIELLVLFPIYRTYIGPELFSDRDQIIIHETVGKAKEKNPDLLNEIDFLEHLILSTSKESDRRQKLIMKFQQFTGPLMAKGIEDTAMYIFYRLLSLNEVGGDPRSFGVSLNDFHRFNEERANNWPNSMNATSTHDTKRGEDVRARINVLSEMPEIWKRQILAWSKMNEGLKKRVKGRVVPDKNDEYFLYQALIGSLPFASDDLSLFRDRIKAYIVKAVREAKIHSSWVKPYASYEMAFISFLENILESEEFQKAFCPFQKKVAYFGILNSLTQTLIKITAPGVPDFYQGTELWDFSFVDPDNRRPVDFEKRRSYLKEIARREQEDILDLIKELLSTKEDGRLKLFLIHRALRSRKENANLFSQGIYKPLAFKGISKKNLITFARKQRNAWALIIAPRFTTTLPGNCLGRQAWGDSRIILPDNTPTIWKNAITDQVIKGAKKAYLGDILQHFPVALLLGKEER